MGQAPGRLEQSGASMIAVHGRTRSQRHSGLADWDQIGAVRAALSIPVVANGNIQNDRDVDDCMAATGCVGCMSAYGLLKNPAMFSPYLQLTHFVLVSHYLDFCEESVSASRDTGDGGPPASLAGGCAFFRHGVE